MEIYCTRPDCSRPINNFAELDDRAKITTAQQKFCMACGMPLILVGRYMPLKLLGRGGFGAAFLARDRYTPAMRECVVKQLQPSGDVKPQQIKIAQNLFEREAEVLEQLGSTHPQIPNLFAFFPFTTPSLEPGQEDQFFYLVQEFIDGQDLEEELESRGPFSEAQALEVLREILKVLKFVHENGSIHRDIKPSNIMRHRNGRLYLLDFGAVKQVTGAASGRNSTGIYSIGFAPPEQMAGGQVYPSTDLYALAVTMITLLTGKQPGELFDSYSNQFQWRHYVQVSDTLADVLDRMLLSAPNQRFQSAQEVRDALRPPQTPLPLPGSPSLVVQVPPSATIEPPVSQPPDPTPTPTPVTPSPPPASRRPAFPLQEILGRAAFTGFEGGLLAIALNSLMGISGISIGLLGMIIGGIIFTQYRRLIEGKDLAIIAGLTLALLVIPSLRHGLSIATVLLVAILAGVGAIAVTALLRLIFVQLFRIS